MLKTLIEKELKNIIMSPKFVATFAVCSILILLSVFVGIQEYRSAVKQYETGTNLTDQQLRESTNYASLYMRTYRKPRPMQIFVSGVQNDIGRLSNISSHEALKLTNSVYSDDPIFAVFRFIDFAFIVQVVFSLFAILFTYNAINGERESGTLKLVFANAVPRTHYIMAKFIGSWLGMVIPILIPILLGILMVMLDNVPLTSDDWIKVSALIGAALLFFTFFIALGMFVSACAKQSSVSFLTLLVLWVVFVLIIPKVGVMAAGNLVPVPSIAEIEGQQDGFAKDRWAKYTDALQERWQQRRAETEGLSEEEREAYRDERMWDWMQDEDADRKLIEVDINEFNLKLLQDVRNRKAVQEKMAFILSRFSPSSAFSLTAMHLAGTNIDLKSRYEDAMQSYRSDFLAYRTKRDKETGGMGGGLRIRMSGAGLKIDVGRDQGTLEIGDMPRFQAPKHTLSDALAPTVVDFGLLSLYTLFAFAGAFTVFLRYDVR